MSKANQGEVDALYKLLYNQVHDFDRSLPLASTQTVDTFSFQWDKLSVGEYMLIDPWFKKEVARIITEEEILLSPEWFKGKKVLDAGCGGGRWSFGFAQLGCEVTAVDINQSALAFTEQSLQEFDIPKRFFQSPLEKLDSVLEHGEEFDLVWSWGVLHHCESFTNAVKQVAKRVKDGGFLYVYLYGRESLSYDQDINLFKSRIYYNTLPSWEEKLAFLEEKAGGDQFKIHQLHDMYAPLLNRRFTYQFIRELLQGLGFNHITQTVNWTELNIRAIKGEMLSGTESMILPAFAGDSPWFLHHAK